MTIDDPLRNAPTFRGVCLSCLMEKFTQDEEGSNADS